MAAAVWLPYAARRGVRQARLGFCDMTRSVRLAIFVAAVTAVLVFDVWRLINSQRTVTLQWHDVGVIRLPHGNTIAADSVASTAGLGHLTWRQIDAPPDLTAWRMELRTDLGLSNVGILGRTSHAMRILSRNATPDVTCGGRGRFDQLLGRCLCRLHG